jgi:hypothetical protein
MDNKIKALRLVLSSRIKTKSMLDMYRFLSETTGKSYEREINAALDWLRRLDELEKALRK